MINRGILRKSAREVLPVTLLLGALLMLMQAVLAYVLPTFSAQFSSQMLRIEFVRNLIQAMLGTDLAEGIGPQLFVAMPWVHPVVLALVWAHAIIVCTRVPAGEVDRGTIDVLLGLPVSRWELYRSETGAWVVSGIVLLVLGAAGNTIGTLLVGTASLRPEPARVGLVVINQLCLYLAVGAVAWFVASLSDRRGRAIGAVFVVVVASFLLNYLAQFWEPAARAAPLGLLRYYRPLVVLRDGALPARDVIVLLSIAVVLWVTGGLIFARRDLATL
jgi:ABC-2 type transport system permease protein